MPRGDSSSCAGHARNRLKAGAPSQRTATHFKNRMTVAFLNTRCAVDDLNSTTRSWYATANRSVISTWHLRQCTQVQCRGDVERGHTQLPEHISNKTPHQSRCRFRRASSSSRRFARAACRALSSMDRYASSRRFWCTFARSYAAASFCLK